MSQFSTITETQLRAAGWCPGRSIDTSEYEETLRLNGFTVFPIVRDFFAEFGGLRILRANGDPRVQDAWFDFQLKPFIFDAVMINMKFYEDEFNISLCVIGHTDDALSLFMDPTGKVYTDNWELALVLIAPTPEEAIEALCTRRPIEGYNILRSQ